MLTAGATVGMVVWLGLGGVPIANIGGANALTLPAQRHIVRVLHPDGSASLMLALQQEGAGGRGLELFRSNDEGQSWSRFAPIQADPSHRDTADIVQLGQDLALVYSYEGPSLAGSTRHDVYYQRWRYVLSTRSFTPDPPVRVFDSSSSSTAYYRAELVVDSLSRIWVQAFRLNTDGTHSAVLAVSQNGGQTFQLQPDLVTLPRRGGGRLLSLGGSLIFLFHGHDLFGPARYRMREDLAPVSSWGPVQSAFSDGIYHGAALSAVAAGGGQMHLVYKSEREQTLWYRLFDGADFGPRQQIDGSPRWATQGNATLVGGDLYVFYNRVVTAESSYQVVVRKVSDGVVGPPAVLDASDTFKGYPAALERVPLSAATTPCVFGLSEDPSLPGTAEVMFAPVQGGGAPPSAGPVLFSDEFARSASNLGSQWRQDSGLWRVNGVRAASDLNGPDLAFVSSVSCRDCSVEAGVVGFGAPETALVLRVQGARPGDRYEVALLSSGQIQIRRRLSGATVVLGQAAAGVPLWDWATLSLSAVGSGQVTLTASVNGVPRLSVVDAAPGALAQPGLAGLWTTRAGVAFDRFRIRSETAGAP